ncbi:MAG: hypothetical protein QOD88_821 [Mycobacterium sp.]|jgi:hypothetical protein|nr:hypothetical protein [Mycobacterium sp.]
MPVGEPRQLRGGVLTAAVGGRITASASSPRIATAMDKADSTRSARIWSSIAQPITRREQPSRTAHKYSQPCLVRS